MSFDPRNVKTAGDSWSSAHASDTDDQFSGWPVVLGVPAENRFAIPGSTAAEWAADEGGRLTRFLDCPARIAILSLGGNDVHRGQEFMALPGVLENVTAVLRSVRPRCERTILLLYANPFPGSWFYKGGVWALNKALTDAACEAGGVEIFHCQQYLEPSHFLQRDQNDIHPTMLGWEAVAAALRKRLEKGD